jgi:hypothetical protein
MTCRCLAVTTLSSYVHRSRLHVPANCAERRSPMAWKRRHPRRGWRTDGKGRSIGQTRFVKLDHWLLKTPAWRSLSPASRALYVELAQRYNGANNGEISLSVRETAELVHIPRIRPPRPFTSLRRRGSSAATFAAASIGSSGTQQPGFSPSTVWAKPWRPRTSRAGRSQNRKPVPIQTKIVPNGEQPRSIVSKS